MARARRPVFVGCTKKLAHLDLSRMTQEECASRGVGKVSPYFEAGESIFGLGFTPFHGLFCSTALALAS